MVGFVGYEEFFIGEDFLWLECYFEVLFNFDFYYGRCWLFDLVFWDLCGKIIGEFVWWFLGGKMN